MGHSEKLRCEDYMNIFDSDPPRPKGMHERTFNKLAARYEKARFEALSNGPPGAMAWY